MHAGEPDRDAAPAHGRRPGGGSANLPQRLGVAFNAREVERWTGLAAAAAGAAAGPRPADVIDSLQLEIGSNPESPLAATYHLWSAQAWALAGRDAEALRSIERCVEAKTPDDLMLSRADVRGAALRQRAEIHARRHELNEAISALDELSALRGGDPEALFDAARLADEAGRLDVAAERYGRAVDLGRDHRRRTDDPAELARRALLRLEAHDVALPNVATLAELIRHAVRDGDAVRLGQLASTTHFAAGPLGGHTAFESREIVERLLTDLTGGQIRVDRRVIGSGEKRYVRTRGWRGRLFRGEVYFILTRAPRGWQWTGLGLGSPTEEWLERWRPPTIQTNQPLPFPLLAPWPAGQSFTAGGLTEFIVQSAAVAAAGGFLGLGSIALAFAFSLSNCGFGTRGFYYNQGPTHDDEDAFAIDFTRYRRGVPFDNESQGTPVLAPLDGVVVNVRSDRPNGDSSTANMVEVMHPDPATGLPRFLSRYLHLEGPGRIPVAVGMPVRVGNRLGQMDDTGNSVVHHLHFSIHDQNVPFPGASRGASVRPTPLDGTALGDGGSNTCLRSTNRERRVMVPIRLNDLTDQDRFVTQHWVHTETGDGLQLWTLTGIVILHLRGTGEEWLGEHVILAITVPEIPDGRPLRLHHWAPFVTLNAIGNDNVAHDAGWAVDWFRLVAPGTPIQQQVTVETQVAVRDSDGWLFRLGYEVTLAGTFDVDVTGPLNQPRER